MGLKKTLYTTIGICFIIILIIILAFIINFSSQAISDKVSDWGTFGDYFGGLLNPIIGVLNLIALVYISFVISKLEEKRNLHELQSQKKFTLYSLQHDSLKKLNRILEKVQPELVKSNAESRINIILVRNELNSYITTHSYLFPFFKDRTWQSLKDSIEDLSELSHKYYSNDKSDSAAAELITKLSEYNEYKIKFITEVQNKIEI
jgi:hypothetical protein